MPARTTTADILLPRELADLFGLFRWLGPWWIAVLLGVVLTFDCSGARSGSWGLDPTPAAAVGNVPPRR